MVQAEKEAQESLLGGLSAKSRKRLVELGSLHRSELSLSPASDVEGALGSAEQDIAEASLRNQYSPHGSAADAALADADEAGAAGRQHAIPEDREDLAWQSVQPMGSRSSRVQFARHVRSASGSTYETRA